MEDTKVQLDWRVVLSCAIFAVCVATTLVSYVPYQFRWDDSDFLWRGIAAGRAFWLAHGHGTGVVVRGSRAPIMTLLGLSLGPSLGWEAAGRYFIALTAATALFVACSLFLLLRSGITSIFMVLGSVCLFAALGPHPSGSHAHLVATALLGDSLLGWIAFAAVLLIPYEVNADTSHSAKDSLARGLLWAAIFSMGAITKASFWYFIVVLVPILFFLRMRNKGLGSALLALLSLSACSIPVIFFCFIYGRTLFENAYASAFGHAAKLFYVPLWKFLITAIRESPGMLLSLTFVLAIFCYVVVKRREFHLGVNLLPLLVMIGYCAICLASSNREIRFFFPGVIGIPFLAGLLISGNTMKTPALSPRSSTLVAALVFVFLIIAAVPPCTGQTQSIALGEAIVGRASTSGAKHVMLVTNTSTLNYSLLKLAIEIYSPKPDIELTPPSFRFITGAPIEEDFRDIREADLVVFQDEMAFDSPLVNSRLPEEEQCARQYFGEPVEVAGGLRIYGKR